MKYLVYIEANEAAMKEAELLRKEGHKVQFRNARFFKEKESCDVVVTNDDKVKEAYSDKDVRSSLVKPVKVEEASKEDKPQPKKKTSKKK